jgi:hypothetical protein
MKIILFLIALWATIIIYIIVKDLSFPNNQDTQKTSCQDY